MAKLSDNNRPVCDPIEPCDLYKRLSDALSAHDERGVLGPKDIVSQVLPPLDDPSFRDRYLLKEVLRKYPDFDLGVDTARAALESFKDDERLNLQTNIRLLESYPEDPGVSETFELASREIASCLGRFSPELWLEGSRFGPGASTRLSKEIATTARKLSGNPHCTPAARPLGELLIRDCPLWADRIAPNGVLHIELVEADKMQCVPKNALTDRTIGIAPDLNLFGQLGLGYVIRQRLSRVGVNLNDQSINQDRARLGSLNGELATLDLKSASNSVTKSLVYRLIGSQPHEMLDPRWYAMLDALRTPRALIGDEMHEYELFSAMGNGYTFELESLIFWALARATCIFLGVRPDVSVYGDDLIVPVESVEHLKRVLAWTGFRLNDQKSFWQTGRHIFRESCGKHFLNGQDVTPFYVDTPLTEGHQIVLLANNLVRWATHDSWRDARILPVWIWVVSHLSPEFRDCHIPYGESDDGLICAFDEANPSIVYRLGVKPPSVFSRGPERVREDGKVGGPLITPGVDWFKAKTTKTFIGYRCRTFSYENREILLDGPGGYITRLYLDQVKKFTCKSGEESVVGRLERILSVREPTALKVSKNRKKSYRFKSRCVVSWPHLGPWVTDDVVLDKNDIAIGISLTTGQQS